GAGPLGRDDVDETAVAPGVPALVRHVPGHRHPRALVAVALVALEQEPQVPAVVAAPRAVPLGELALGAAEVVDGERGAQGVVRGQVARVAPDDGAPQRDGRAHREVAGGGARGAAWPL